MSTQVVRLGAWCDVVTEDELGVSFRVEEFAVLGDGRRLILHADRGFEVRSHRFGATPVDPWTALTAEQLRTDVYTTVLPDDAEESGEEHAWGWLSALLRARGVVSPPEELRVLPYDVVFSERLRLRLMPGL